MVEYPIMDALLLAKIDKKKIKKKSVWLQLILDYQIRRIWS